MAKIKANSLISRAELEALWAFCDTAPRVDTKHLSFTHPKPKPQQNHSARYRKLRKDKRDAKTTRVY